MAQAIVKIVGQDLLKQPLQQASKDVQSFGDTISNIGAKIGKAIKVTTITAAIYKVVDGLKDCFNAFNTADRAYKQLSIALNDSKGFASVKSNIQELSKITLSSKGDLEAMASELAALGKDSDEINKISEAAVHLSNVTGKDLNASMTTLLNTYNGTTTQLNRLGIDTSNLTKEQLAEGAAVDLLIEKYGDLSRAMAEDDSSQHIKNIKDNLGDIGQSIGQIVNASIAPLLRSLDEFTSKAKEKAQDIANTVTVFIQGLPEIWSHLLKALGNSFKTFWQNISNVENIKVLLEGIVQIVISRIKLIGNALANIWILFREVGERVGKGLKNLAMSWIVGITDSIGINISDVINKIGQWMLDSPVGKVIDNILTKAYNGVMTIVTIIKNIPDIFKIVFDYIGDLLTTFIHEFPNGIKNVLKGLGNGIVAGILNIKNTFLQTVEDALNSIGEWIQSTWVGKAMAWMGLDLGGKLANIDFGIDRSSQLEYESKSNQYYAAAGAAFAGTTAIAEEMAKKIDELMSPKIKKVIFDNGETVATKMATYTAKSSKEYYDEALKNFKDIGTFLEDWGTTFLGDLGDDWGELKESLSSFYTNAFGGDFAEFTKWLKAYVETQKKPLVASQNNGVSTGTDSSNSSENSSGNASDSIHNWGKKLGEDIQKFIKELGSTVWKDFKSQIGEFGDVVSSLVSNISTLGTTIGLIVTALHYVIQGFVEVFGDLIGEFISYILEPLREIGRVIADILMPLLEAVMPSIQQAADFLIQVFNMIGMVLKPIAVLIGTVLGPVLKLITSFLERILLPVLKAITAVFLGVVSAIEWVTDRIRWVVQWIKSWFGGPSPDRVRSYDEIYEGHMNELLNGTDSSGSYGTSGTTNASYQGSTTVYLNVYNNGYVVGDNGIQEFAIMIRDEIENINYYHR